MNKYIWPNALTRIDDCYGSIKSRHVHSTVAVFVTIIWLLPATGAAQDFMDCGSLESSYGPYDYTNPEHVRSKLPIVEKAHFTRDVENLIRGSTTSKAIGDISYTLRTFPNHHRALYAMVKYNLRLKERPIAGMRQSPECWFDRAIRFKPTDGNVRIINGIYLHRIGQNEKALQAYTEALALLPSSGELHYNLGLLYFDMSEYELSKKHAAHAYELGYPLQGLRRKLEKIG